MPIAPEILNGTLRSDLIASQKVPVFMDDMIAFEDESSFRFESLLRRLNGSKGVSNIKSEFMEMGLYPNVMQVQAVAAIAATAITVDHPEYAHRDQLVYNTRTNETFIMNEDVGGTTAASQITILNQAGSGGLASAAAVGDILLILLEAHAEGEAVPDPWSAKPRFLYTYIMQYDYSLGKYTDLAQVTGEYGEKQLAINRKQKWIEQKRAKNLKLYLGSQMLETTSAGVRRMSARGLRDWIVTNRVDFSGAQAFNMTALGELMRGITLIGASSDKKVGIAGQNAWVKISTFPNSAVRTTEKVTDWGWVLNYLRTPFGNLALEYDPQLSQQNGLADVMAVLDMAHISMEHLEGNGRSLKDRMYLDVGTARDIHNTEDVFSGTCGLKVKLEELHAWGYGIK
jgi:hypothetical protein